MHAAYVCTLLPFAYVLNYTLKYSKINNNDSTLQTITNIVKCKSIHNLNAITFVIILTTMYIVNINIIYKVVFNENRYFSTLIACI